VVNSHGGEQPSSPTANSADYYSDLPATMHPRWRTGGGAEDAKTAIALASLKGVEPFANLLVGNVAATQAKGDGDRHGDSA